MLSKAKAEKMAKKKNKKPQIMIPAWYADSFQTGGWSDEEEKTTFDGEFYVVGEGKEEMVTFHILDLSTVFRVCAQYASTR